MGEKGFIFPGRRSRLKVSSISRLQLHLPRSFFRRETEETFNHFANWKNKISIVFNNIQVKCGNWALSAVGSYDTV
jgi:hypothetical protein